MDDFRDETKTAEPASRPSDSYAPADAAKEAVFSADDVYFMGKLPAGGESSMFISLLKAIAGALVGALPGLLLWIIVGRFGFIAPLCGGVLALGTVAGYTFMSKDGELPSIYGIISCIAIIVVSIFLAEKVVYCWKMADMFPQIIATIKEPLYVLGEAGGLERSTVNEIVDENLKEGLGFSESSFSNFFFNFSRSLRYFGLTGRYYFNLVLSYAVAAAGSYWMYRKATK
ncbi:MAG: hypothetical protein IKW87_08920 [Ruminococcus sp.]|nr:hypothetical protein [Ruminococcus sp.]